MAVADMAQRFKLLPRVGYSGENAMRNTIGSICLVATLTLGSTTMVMAQQPPSSAKTADERFAEALATFKESPAEEAAKQVVLKRFKLDMEGKAMEAMKLVSPNFTEHMTPARMPKDGKTAYQRFMERAKQTEAKGNPPATDKKMLEFPTQARASEDLVTLFHAYGCDIFRVQGGLVTDHWDCTPWEPFSNKGERAQLREMAEKQAGP
jgi:predicted SnoaL-like aldol condensation-catalyzing enzyme